jgi:Holliday junction DNA helicase RuvB
MDHTFPTGPPGLGKTRLARIVAHELGVNFHSTSGPIIAKTDDLAAVLMNLKFRDVLFIDEIHRLSRPVEETLYATIQDFRLDKIVRKGRSASAVRRELRPFTVIGATTEIGLLSKPLRDRFGIPVCLQFYSEADLEKIVDRVADILGVEITQGGANESRVARAALRASRSDF